MEIQAFYQQTGNAITGYLYQELKLAHGDHYRIERVTDAPRVLTLSVAINPRYARDITKMAGELSMAAALDGDTVIRIGRGARGTLSVEIPKPSNLWRTVKVSDLPRRKGTQVVAGVDVGKVPALIDVSDSLTPHWLVAGMTGSGKTNAQRRFFQALAAQCKPSEVGFILIDTEKRGKAWRAFERVPHLVHPLVVEHDEAGRVLAWAVAEMDRRAREDRQTPRIVIGVDEIQGLFQERPDLIKVVDRIAAVGREWGVHLVIATQNPTAEHLGSASIKRNMARLVGRVSDSTAALVATGQRESGAEGLTAAGDMLRIDPDGIKRLAVALVTEADLEAMPRVERVGELDLSQYEDVERVTEARAEPVTPEHVAYALTTEKGLRHLQTTLGIGASKARRVREFADSVRVALAGHGCTVAPLHRQGE